jgi:SAM-dependent methyltransferase
MQLELRLPSCVDEMRESMPGQATAEIYATPPSDIPPLDRCEFYHSIDLPGLGEQTGYWDLRAGIASYLGPTNFDGMRVLEIGTANGFVCFELERRGAEVVAVDLPETESYDARPLATGGEGMEEGLRRIRNAYWLGHALTGSSAKVVYAHVNALPDAVGHFDVAVLANVLQHLRDPLGALMSVARRTDAIVVTEADWMHGMYEDVVGMMLFQGPVPYSWFQLRLPLLTTFLAELGFGEQQVSRHEQIIVAAVDFDGPVRRREMGEVAVPHFTVTASRS